MKLDNITLVCFGSRNQYDACIKAIEYSCREISFNSVYLFSDKDLKIADKRIENIVVTTFNSVSEWGKFIIFELYQYIKTPYIFLIHEDGFIVNPNQWRDDFLKYDYIGAPWPKSNDGYSYISPKGKQIRVGNSVSIRSKKILELPSKLKLDWDDAHLSMFHEDGFLCVQHHETLVNNGISFAPYELACHFAREEPLKENINISPLAFHKWKGPNSKFPCFNRFFQFKKKIKRILK